MEKPWAELTREEKRAQRVKKYLAPPNVKFNDVLAR